MSSATKSVIAKFPAREWKGLVPLADGGRLRVAMTCHICGATDHWTAAQMVGPQTAIPKVIHMGWRADGKVTCPSCIAAKRNKPARKVVPMKAVAAIPTTAPVDLDQGKKHKRLTILALEDYYDEAARRYREGRSDKTVADELDLAEGFVAKVREEFYGAMAEPDDIATFRFQIDSLQTSLDELKSTFASTCQRNGWKM